LKLGQIAERLDCELKGDANIDIQRVAGIDEAQPGDLTFLSNRKYAPRVKTTSASALIVEPSFPEIATAAAGWPVAKRLAAVTPSGRPATLGGRCPTPCHNPVTTLRR